MATVTGSLRKKVVVLDSATIDNITVSGNVDGRDVSVDGAKLDTIESNATADQTAAQVKAHLVNGIDSTHYVDGSIDRVHLAADIIDSTKLADDSVNSEHYVNGSIDAAHIGNDQINSQHYAAGSIDNEHIADNAVNSEHYADGSIDRVHLAADIVDGTKFANAVINSEHYVAGSIDRGHLAADIIDGTKIANDVINSEHYVAGSIDNEHIADNAINSEHYADNSIDALHLNVSGNGTTSQWLRSDGDGTMSWVAPPNTTYSDGNGITQTGTVFSITSHAGTAGTIGTVNSSGNTLGVSLGTTSTTAAAGNHTHSTYAASSHTHSYLPLAGGIVTGGLQVNGAFKMDGNTVFNGSDTWMRTTGATGWYSSSYGGGMYMTDTTWVKTFNSKALYVANQIAATGNVTAYYSDERLKTSTGNIDNALDKVKSLNGFTYVENELARSLGYSNTRQQVGISAQEIQAVLPEAVSLAPVDMHTDEFSGEITSLSGEDYLTVDYSRIVPLLIEAMKEQQVQIDGLKLKLEELA